MRNRIWKSVFGFFFVLSVQQVVVAQDRKALISFCNLSVNEEVNQANTHFTNRYRFRITEEGKPTSISVANSKFVKLEDIEACLTDWKFVGFSKKNLFVLYLKWEHGVGWSEMKIISKDFSQTISQGSRDCSK